MTMIRNEICVWLREQDSFFSVAKINVLILLVRSTKPTGQLFVIRFPHPIFPCDFQFYSFSKQFELSKFHLESRFFFSFSNFEAEVFQLNVSSFLENGTHTHEH